MIVGTKEPSSKSEDNSKSNKVIWTVYPRHPQLYSEFSNYLENKENIFLEFFKAMLNDRKKVGTKPDSLLKLLDNQINQVSKEALNLELQDIVLSVFEWVNMSKSFKLRHIRSLVISGNVEKLRKCIEVKDPDTQNMIDKTIYYLAVEHNQQGVLDLLWELGAEQGREKIKKSLLRNSIQKGNLDMSIDLINNKGVTLSEKIALSASKHQPPEFINTLIHTIRSAKTKQTNAESLEHYVNDNEILIEEACTFQNDEKSNLYQDPRLVEGYIDIPKNLISEHFLKGTIITGEVKQLKWLIETGSVSTINYLKANMAEIALNADRFDMLTLAFQEFVSQSEYSYRNAYANSFAARAAQVAGCESFFEYLSDNHYELKLSLLTYLGVLHHCSVPLAEKLFMFCDKSNQDNLLWIEIYGLAFEKCAYGVENFIKNMNQYIETEKIKSIIRDRNDKDNIVDVSEWLGVVPSPLVFENSLKRPRATLEQVSEPDPKLIKIAEQNLAEEVQLKKLITTGTVEDLVKIIDRNSSHDIKYLKENMLNLAFNAKRLDMVQLAFQKVFSSGSEEFKNNLANNAVSRAATIEGCDEFLNYLIANKYLLSIQLPTYYKLLDNCKQNTTVRLFKFRPIKNDNDPMWIDICRKAIEKRHFTFLKLIEREMPHLASQAKTAISETDHADHSVSEADPDFDSLFKNPIILDIINNFDFRWLEDDGLNLDGSFDTQYPQNVPHGFTKVSLDESDLNVKDAALDPEISSLPSPRMFITQYDPSSPNILDDDGEFETYFPKRYQP